MPRAALIAASLKGNGKSCRCTTRETGPGNTDSADRRTHHHNVFRRAVEVAPIDSKPLAGAQQSRARDREWSYPLPVDVGPYWSALEEGKHGYNGCFTLITCMLP